MSVDAATILLTRHEQLPARAGAAGRVLQLADDPDTSAQDLARAMGTDPVFAARVLRMANSSYYGLSGRVSTLPFAVSVVGFQAVRSLAVVAAAGLDDPAATPEGFWEGAATAATAAEVLAPMLGADPGDSFSVGLLHTLGAALLHQHEAHGLICLPETREPDELAHLEREHYGITHEYIAARVLLAWHFPAPVCDVIGRHHDPLLPDAEPLERTLHAAHALADRLLNPQAVSSDAEIAWLTQGRVTAIELPAITERIRTRAERLLEGLTAGR